MPCGARPADNPAHLEPDLLSEETTLDLAAATLRPGQRVVHRYFGIGTIIEIERGGMKARVRFGDDAASERSLLTRVLSPLA